MSKTWSVTKYFTNIYRCVIFCITLFYYIIRNMTIFLIFCNIGWTLKTKFFFYYFLRFPKKKSPQIRYIFFLFRFKKLELFYIIKNTLFLTDISQKNEKWKMKFRLLSDEDFVLYCYIKLFAYQNIIAALIRQSA